MNMEFVQQAAAEEGLPLHIALKPSKTLSEEGVTINNPKPNAWKYERFIFDILPLAQKVAALMVPREACFSPLKNSEGEGSPSSVTAALLQKDKTTLAKITGLPAPNFDFELTQEFHYPTTDLLRKWKGKTPRRGGYINP